MYGDRFFVGDRVIVSVDEQTRRACGINPAPDGSRAIITEVGETLIGRFNSYGHKPGIYASSRFVTARLEDGDGVGLEDSHIELADARERTRRRKAHKLGDYTGLFLRDLPKTPFWEGDLVVCSEDSRRCMRLDRSVDTFMIVGIRYDHLETEGAAPYIISDYRSGTQEDAGADDLKLVRRGRVWQYYHGEPIRFRGLDDEVAFYLALGLVTQQNDPDWLRDEWTYAAAKKGLHEGVIHAVLADGARAGYVRGVRCYDPALGERLAKETLESFDAFLYRKGA